MSLKLDFCTMLLTDAKETMISLEYALNKFLLINVAFFINTYK